VVGAAGRPGVRRRASVLDRGEVVTDADPDDCPTGRRALDRRPGRAIVPPGWYAHAARHGLCSSTPTSPTSAVTASAGVRGFEVSRSCRFGKKLCAKHFRARCGRWKSWSAESTSIRRIASQAASRRANPLSLVITRIGTEPASEPCLHLPGLGRRVRGYAGGDGAGAVWTARGPPTKRTLRLAAVLPRPPAGRTAIAVAGAQNNCAALAALPPTASATFGQQADLRDGSAVPHRLPDEQASSTTSRRAGTGSSTSPNPARGICPTKWTPPHRHSAPLRRRAQC